MIIKIPKKVSAVIFFFFLCFFIVPENYSQTDNIPINEPVYNFLKKMQVQGLIRDYDDSVLPLTRGEVVQFLQRIEDKESSLDQTEAFYLKSLKKKFDLTEERIDIFNDFPDNLSHNLFTAPSKHLYHYIDSNYVLAINPVLRYKYIYRSSLKNNSNLFEFGGEIYGGYKNWFGFYVKATNGIQSGSRSAASADNIVRRSFTFNNTGRNNFDFTLGYLNIVKEPFHFELGREEILWGTGYLNKMIISNNSQPMDFVKFSFGYKSLKYTFLHAWLVQKPIEVPINDTYGNLKYKNSKYLAVSRLQFKPSSSFQISASQLIIYSNRAPELAYLNPFLFWESAQRSLNDLDNSLLAFESRINPVKGAEISGSIVFDDINFENIFNGKWAGINNGFGWQAGTFITYPLLWRKLAIKIEYIQLRPFLYTHPGYPEALTYTNNGDLIGTDLQPNSTRLSLEGSYLLSSRIRTVLGGQYTLHGNNIKDKNGNIVKNAGGDVFQPVRVNDPEFVYLLGGDLEREMKIYSELEYQFLPGYYINFYIANYKLNDNSNYFDLWGQFRLDLN